MGAKVNLVLDEEVKASLDQMVPPGKRSEFANEAIRIQLRDLRRRRAVEQLETLRQRGPSVPTAEIVRMLREDREGVR